MSQIDEIPRTVPGAELFFGESVAQYLAELSEQVYGGESEAEGLLLGKFYKDSNGVYVVVSGVVQDISPNPAAVGMFKISPDCESVGLSDIRKAFSIFGNTKSYLIMLNSERETMAMYSLDAGSVKIAASVMVENL